jgi:hypothetical protein
MSVDTNMMQELTELAEKYLKDIEVQSPQAVIASALRYAYYSSMSVASANDPFDNEEGNTYLLAYYKYESMSALNSFMDAVNEMEN